MELGKEMAVRRGKRRAVAALAAAFVAAASVPGVAGITAVEARAETRALELCTVELADTADGVELTWNAVEGAESYDIYRKTGEDGDYSQVAVADAGETSWTDGTAGEATYTYYVQPVSGEDTWGYEEASITHRGEETRQAAKQDVIFWAIFCVAGAAIIIYGICRTFVRGGCDPLGESLIIYGFVLAVIIGLPFLVAGLPLG